jgi:hypothetical protein
MECAVSLLYVPPKKIFWGFYILYVHFLRVVSVRRQSITLLHERHISFCCDHGIVGANKPSSKDTKSDDCVSLGIDHPGARCTTCKYKQDQLVQQYKRKKKKQNH